MLSEELDNILIKNGDNDTSKTLLETKDEMKRRIGRSPDYSDALMMRFIFVVREEESKVEEQ
jgi:hypothetical protein